MKVVGRKHIVKQLKKKLTSKKAELIAVTGRRRVGKTYVIKHTYQKELLFHFTGLFKGKLQEHLQLFSQKIQEVSSQEIAMKTPESWFGAFDQLKYIIDQKPKGTRKVIFLDEFPWMVTNRSRFLTAFTYWWNDYAVNKKGLIVVICGSSASWMINKVLKNKGGLHNRVTDKIILEPFSLGDTKSLLEYKGIKMSNYDIVRLYMAVGGIPYYIEQLNKGESYIQFIDRVCFAKNGILRTEYDELFASLFNNSENHQKIIEALNIKSKGLTRDEIISRTSLESGGGMSKILEELEVSGFIKSYLPYDKKKKDKLYKLQDNYVLFYLKYIKNSKVGQEKVWEKIASKQSFTSWSGLAFENICQSHLHKINEALGIEGIYSEASSWQHRGTDEMPGAQIDLIIDRADNIISMCEMKFVSEPYVLTKDYSNKMLQKMASFKFFTKTKKVIFPVFVSTYGLIQNKYSNQLIQNEVLMDDLF